MIFRCKKIREKLFRKNIWIDKIRESNHRENSVSTKSMKINPLESFPKNTREIYAPPRRKLITNYLTEMAMDREKLQMINFGG